MSEHSWQALKLGALRSTQPRTLDPSAYCDEEFEYYSIPAYQKGGLPQIRRGSEIESNKLLLPPNCVLFGKLNPRVEKVWMTGPANGRRMVGSTEWLPIKVADGHEPWFVYFLLWSSQVMPKAKQMVSGSTPSRQRVDPLAFYGIQVQLPDIDEQRQIARVLATVQRAIEQQQAIIATTRELKRGLMHKLFTEGLRGGAQKPTEIGLVPESWEVVRLGDCCDVVSSAIPYTELEKAANFTGDDAIDVMGVKVSDMNLPGNELAFNRANLERKMPPSLLRKRLIAAGTIVFPKRGAAIATNKKRIATGWTVLDPNLIGVVAGERLNADFLFHQFQRVDLRKITDPGPTPQLNKKDLLPLWLPVPPTLDEQVEIASSVGTVQAKIDSECAKQDLLNDLFKTLLHQLMTAQLRVHDLDLDALGVPALD